MPQFTTIVTKADRVQEMEDYIASNGYRKWDTEVTANDEAEAVKVAQEEFKTTALNVSEDLEEAESYSFAISESSAYEVIGSKGEIIGWEVDSL